MVKQIFLKGHPLEFTLDVDTAIRACFEKIRQTGDRFIHCNFGTTIQYSETRKDYAIILQLAETYNSLVIVREFTDERVFDTDDYKDALISINNNIEKVLKIADDNPNKADIIRCVLSMSSQAEFSKPQTARTYIQAYLDDCNIVEFFSYADGLADSEMDYKMCQQLVKLNPPIVMNVTYADSRIPFQTILDDNFIDCNPKQEPIEFIIAKMLQDQPYYIFTGATEQNINNLKRTIPNYNRTILKLLLHDHLNLFKVELVPSPEHVINRQLPELYYNTIPAMLRPYSEKL